MATQLRFIVEEAHAGKRIDQAIAAHLPKISRTRAKLLLGAGGVFVDRKRVKIAGRLVHAGQKVEVHLGDVALSSPEKRSEVPHIPIVSQTDDYVIVNKPSGVFSAPTPETDQNDLLYFLKRQLGADGADGSVAPHLFLVHRLDRPTSGLMVLACNKKAAANLSAQVAEHHMKRRYQAALVGEMESEEQSVTSSVADKEAHTIFTRIKTKGPLTLVEAELKTGRTHQVRVHATSINAPVAGDSKYGRVLQRALQTRPPRLALHAFDLQFSCPSSGKALQFAAPWPADLADWWEKV